MTLSKSLSDLQEDKNDISEHIEFEESIIITEHLPEFVDVSYTEDNSISIDVSNS